MVQARPCLARVALLFWSTSALTSLPRGIAPFERGQTSGADVAKHCVPAVSGERVSITFRKMRGVTLGSKKRTVEYKGPDCAPPAVDFRVRA